jgi:hypothetical protein
MSRQGTSNAQKSFNESQDTYNTAQGNSNSLYSSLFPAFTAEATNPQGFGATDLAAMNTASQQSIGGATAGAVGQGSLRAARTRNSGGQAAEADSAVKSGEQTLSQNALGIQGENAALKQEQKQAGLSGLSGLYGENNSTMLSALGLGNQATQVGAQAGQEGWFQNMTGLINSLGNAAGGAGKLAEGVSSCWIAEALYGVNDPRTHLLRSWLNQEFRETALGQVVMPLYARFGKLVAFAVRMSKPVRNFFQPLFEQALAAAMKQRGLEEI